MLKTNCSKIAKFVFILVITPLIFVAYINTSNVAAQTSTTINFQGKIVRNDSGYEGLNVTDGSPACVVAGADTCDFQVKYYDAATAGTLLLTETFDNEEIGQYGGIFELSLATGTPTAAAYSTVDAMIQGEDSIYVEILFAPGGAGSYTETFTRMPLQASAFAIKSKYSTYSDSASGALGAFLFENAADETGYTGSSGMVYYDSTDAVLKLYTGGTWVDLATGASSIWGTDSITSYSHSPSQFLETTGIATLSNFGVDATVNRAWVHGASSRTGLSVYSNYSGATDWPLVTFKADAGDFGNSILQLIQDGTGNIFEGYKGSDLKFRFDNAGNLHLASDGVAYLEPFPILPGIGDLLPGSGEGCLYSAGGSLYWDSACDASSPMQLNVSSSLWTDGGTFSYLTSTTDDLVLGGSTIAASTFFFDIDGSSGSYFEVDNSDNSSRLFTIDSTGNVGIGTATPGAKLEIGGSASTIANSTGDITITPAEDLVISQGKLGIGTAAPTSKLEIFVSLTDQVSGVYAISDNATTYGSTMHLGGTDDVGAAIPNYLKGALGLGTTSPDFPLQVNGVIAPETSDQDLGTTSLRWDLLANTINADSTVTLTGLGTGTDNSVVILNSSNQLTTDEINARVWESTVSLLDGSSLTANYVPKASDGDTLVNSMIYDSGTGVGIGTTSLTEAFEVNGDAIINRVFVTGRSTSWGSTNGVDTGGINVTMGTSTAATWLLSGTSGGTFLVGMQALDVNGTLRIYSGGGYMTISGAALSGISTISMSGQLTSTLASGTAPFVVASNTLVTNLNADLLDGLNSAATATASTIVARDSAGDIFGRYFFGTHVSISHAAATRNTDTIFYSSTDAYVRKNTAAGMITSLGLNSGTVVTGLNADTVDGISSASFIRSDADDTVGATTTWNDSEYVRLGTGADLRLYHDATNSFIANYTGQLYIRNANTTASNIYMQGVSNEAMIYAYSNGAVNLYYNGVQRLATTSLGVTIKDRAVIGTSSTTTVYNNQIFSGSSALELQYGSAGNVQIGAGGGTGGLYTIRNSYAGTRTGGAIDLAEWIYVPDNNIEKGDIVVAHSSISDAAEISTRENQNSILGVISTSPHMTMGQELVEKYGQEKVLPLALAGRVPVKVVIDGESIQSGDVITSSNLAGYGKKATKEGSSVGKALESFIPSSSCILVNSVEEIVWPTDDGKNPLKPCYKLSDGRYVGKIMILVNVSWFDPEIQKISTFSTITSPGWYRIAQTDGTDSAKVLIQNTSLGSSQNTILQVGKENINIVSNFTSGEYNFSKLRLNTQDSITYLEIYIENVNNNNVGVKIADSESWKTTTISNIAEPSYDREYNLNGILFAVSDSFSASVEGFTTTGSLLTNNVSSNIGDTSNRWNDIYTKGTIRLGSGSEEGGIRYNIEKKRLEFSNDGITWVEMGDTTSSMVLSPEYSGAILYADGSDNYGRMTSDALEDSGVFKNYYEWRSDRESLQDYDILVRVTLPSDFVSWKDNAISLDFMTENSGAVANNKVDMYLMGSSGIDAQTLDGISKLPGSWERISINSLDITECTKAGDSCTIRLSLSSKENYFVRVGDISLNYNRGL